MNAITPSSIRILHGDCRDVMRTLPDQSVQCCVTSPPYYGLRDYGVDGQIGLESSPQDYVDQMVQVFGTVRRVLRDDGTLWLNLGDSYASTPTGGLGKSMTITGGKTNQAAGLRRPDKSGHAKPKDLLGIPWRVAFALQADGWWLRSAIVWAKPNPMPESVTDRPTSSYEMVFLLSKSATYFYDTDAIREPNNEWSIKALESNWTRKSRNASPDRNDGNGNGNDGVGASYASKVNPNGANARNVWTIATQPYSGAHFATMPPDLAERCIKAGSKPGDTVLDPFGGAGTTGLVADRLGRRAVLIELNSEYAGLATGRIVGDCPLFASVT